VKLSDARKAYNSYTGQLSTVTRQLNFAGIGVVWILRIGKNSGGVPFSTVLLVSLGAFVVSLFLDLLHYSYAAIAWGSFHRHKEVSDTSETDEFLAPAWINWPSLVFFWGKVLACVIGHLVLVSYICVSII